MRRGKRAGGGLAGLSVAIYDKQHHSKDELLFLRVSNAAKSYKSFQKRCSGELSGYSAGLAKHVITLH